MTNSRTTPTTTTTDAGQPAELPALAQRREGAAVWLRLQRPAAMNAISTDLLDQLNLALDEIEADESVRVVVLNDTGEVDPSRVVEFVSYAGRTIERLAALAQPVIAGVNGLALAGGLELLLASDIVVASSTARIGDAHANYGLIPGGGGSVRLARVVGTQMAKYLAFTGSHFPASSPVLAGLVSEMVDPEELETR